MKPELRVLIVEDSETDAMLLLREPRRAYDVKFERVYAAATMTAALDAQPWDLVISDYSMPDFSGPAALALLRTRDANLPFIIVSGTIGEETAVDALKAGAHDYLVKGRLARLLPAVERELRESKLRADQKRMQEQLVITDRMASVGTLAAGVAHEINNPLAALIGNLDFIAKQFGSLVESRARARSAGNDELLAWGESFVQRIADIGDPLKDAQKAADRVRHIVRDLKIFSRADEEKLGPVNIHEVLESSLRMAWNEIRHRARVVKDYGDTPPVQGNESRLGQVTLNLLVNAAHAIAEGAYDENEIRIITRREPNGFVALEIRDTGCGIPAEIIERIFDPFFTTKPTGLGTGLGLAICHRLVTAMGGQIEVESQVGKGARFRVSLPMATPPVIAAAPLVPTLIPPRRGRLLVVDDEVAIASVIRRTLGHEHELTFASTAQEALDKFASGERFDVILSDLMMPKITGMDLHAELLRLDPEQAKRMIFMTGGAFTARARAFLDEVQNVRVEKPFDPTTLAILIQNALAARP